MSGAVGRFIRRISFHIAGTSGLAARRGRTMRTLPEPFESPAMCEILAAPGSSGLGSSGLSDKYVSMLRRPPKGLTPKGGINA